MNIFLYCSSFYAALLFYALEPQLAFLQTSFSVMHVNVAFRGKLIRNQLFAFKVSNVSALHFLLLTNIHAHTHSQSSMPAGLCGLIVPTPTQRWRRLCTQTRRLWVWIHKPFYRILIILHHWMNCRQLHFLHVCPGGYNRNMKVLPPLSNLNDVVMCVSTFLFACLRYPSGFPDVT